MVFFIKSNSDFAAGAMVLAGVILIKKVYDLFQYPSVAKTQKIANQTIPKIGDDKSITVYGFELPGEFCAYADGIMDSSPFVNRVEAYLHLKKVAYTKAKTTGLSETPRKKVPFSNVYSIMVDDSSRILSVLQDKLKDDTETTLTEEQRSEGHMVRALLMRSLYFVLLHLHFGTEKGREVFRKALAKMLPAPLLPLIFAMVVRNIHRDLRGCGFGQLPHFEICEIGRKDLRALAVLLGNRKFILDTKEATVYDTDVFSFVGQFFLEPSVAEMEWVREIRKERPALVQYVGRMRDLLYPDLKKVK